MSDQIREIKYHMIERAVEWYDLNFAPNTIAFQEKCHICTSLNFQLTIHWLFSSIRESFSQFPHYVQP